MTGQTAAPTAIKAPDATLMLKVFYAFAALAVISVAISLGGKMAGSSIIMAGHTDSTTTHEIVIGNNVISAQENAIRFEHARRDGVAERLDLYLHWPDMQGYSDGARDDFNHAGRSRRILFLSFEHRIMSRDMSGRFDPIYRSLIAQPGRTGPAGLTVYEFTAASGYVGETLVAAPRANMAPFVARCLTGAAADESLAPCERDIHVGDNLSLTYRFPRELLANWQGLEAGVTREAVRLLQTAR
ncbi:MAG: hypothetical protein AB7I79_12865 [Rhizobiaceae bacterium]